MITQFSFRPVSLVAVFVAGVASAHLSAEAADYPRLKLPQIHTIRLQPITLYRVQTLKPVQAVPAAAAPVQIARPVKAIAAPAWAEFVLVNNTSGWLSLFVDGKRSVSVPPGDRGVTLVVPGFHRFRAQTPDGRYVERSGNIPSTGWTWTVSEQ